MVMRFGRTLPPAAAPIPLGEVLRALPSCLTRSATPYPFKEEVRQTFGQRHCLLVSSGKVAFVLLLQALSRLYPGRQEVLIPAFTCFSVPAAIKQAGLRIRLCDTAENSLDFDLKQLARILAQDRKKKKILCVVVTHLFGCPADIEAIQKIAGNAIPLIEDAAQAMGETIGSGKIGTLGDAGFFSLGRGKALSTMEGGIIITNRSDIGGETERLSATLRECSPIEQITIGGKMVLTTLLQHPGWFWLPKALPFLRLGETLYDAEFQFCRMSSFQKRLTHNWQERLQRHQRARKANIIFWRENLPSTASLLSSCHEVSSLIRLPVLAPSAAERDRWCRKSEETGCGIMPAYPASINEIPEISEEFTGEQYPNAKQLSKCLFTLPVHEYVRDLDRRKIQRLLST